MADGIAIAFGPLGRPADHAATTCCWSPRRPTAVVAWPGCSGVLSTDAWPAARRPRGLLAAALLAGGAPGTPRDYTLSRGRRRPPATARLARWWSAIGSRATAVTRPLAIGLYDLRPRRLCSWPRPGILPFEQCGSGAAPVAWRTCAPRPERRDRQRRASGDLAGGPTAARRSATRPRRTRGDAGRCRSRALDRGRERAARWLAGSPPAGVGSDDATVERRSCGNPGPSRSSGQGHDRTIHACRATTMHERHEPRRRPRSRPTTSC